MDSAASEAPSFVQVARLLLEAGADPSCHNERGESALQWAAWSGSEELVSLLLSYGADLHTPDSNPKFGWIAPLCAAHRASALAIVSLMLYCASRAGAFGLGLDKIVHGKSCARASIVGH